MKRLWVPIFLLASTAAGQSCLDQQYVTQRQNGLEITGNQSAVQTFTCGKNGLLLRVDVDIRHWVANVTTPLSVTLLACDAAGVPTNTVLDSVQIAANDIPVSAYAPVPVRFPNPPVVTVGRVVGVELAVPASIARAYAWSGDAPGNYARGTTFIRRTTGPLSFDMGFQTSVSAPATSTNYGQGHPGGNGVPSLTTSALPRLGTVPNLQLGNSAGQSTAALLLLGTSRAAIPTPFGGTLLVLPLLAETLPLPASGAALPLPIPDDATLCGVLLQLQHVVVDARASHGLAFSPGLELRLAP